jgi:hypothetical protein
VDGSEDRRGEQTGMEVDDANYFALESVEKLWTRFDLDQRSD